VFWIFFAFLQSWQETSLLRLEAMYFWCREDIKLFKKKINPGASLAAFQVVLENHLIS